LKIGPQHRGYCKNKSGRHIFWDAVCVCDIRNVRNCTANKLSFRFNGHFPGESGL